MGDFYSEDRSRLRNQPKKTIGDYVESKGILVPERYKSMEEARESGEDVLCRSESIFEFNGPSGILESVTLSAFPRIKDIEELKKTIFGEVREDGSPDPAFNFSKAGYYFCPINNISPKEFFDSISFSFWHKLEGYNRTVVADDTVKGRYHVITEGNIPGEDGKQEHCLAYSIIENGFVNNIFDMFPKTDKQLDGLIEFYESVRNLERFDGNNCPIMEIQTVNNKHYFLQTLSGRDFSAADFEVKQGKGTEAFFVRGKTSAKGEVFRIAAEFPNDYAIKQPFEMAEGYLQETPDSKNFYYEMLASKWKIAILRAVEHKIDNISYPANIDNTMYMAIVMGHIGTSQLFKPGVSLILNDKDIMSREEREKAHAYAYETKKVPCIDVKVTSDGRKAFVERV
jgi:hypothetical protein